MTQYLVAIHRPDGYDPAVAEDDAMSRDIDALNAEMKAAGVRIFVGGLQPTGAAMSLRAQPDGQVLVTGGPDLQTGACGRLLGAGGRGPGRGAGLGAQGRRRLSGAGGGAPVSLTPATILRPS
jgi:hypothetical protein